MRGDVTPGSGGPGAALPEARNGPVRSPRPPGPPPGPPRPLPDPSPSPRSRLRPRPLPLTGHGAMMRFMLLFSRQGKLRLQKWYLATADKDKKKMVRELMQVVLARKPKMCSFLEWRDLKVVYKRYASLYFCCAIEGQDNELITLELIHRYVELLDKYFGSVCELDIIFNFEKAYFILDEFVMGGEIQDTSKKSVLKAIEQADLLQEEDESPRSVLEEMGLA
ncbi:AP-1 complex subunit sigma-1A isoform X1 [Zonotrichia leucophrys gambelii]|uniref:AP-1 complex subunit sigma-1A isoform X1 n=1 Tax=Zonotrichia leucophrys gambelii TaxID=257770 RepID=UPI003140C77D